MNHDQISESLKNIEKQENMTGEEIRERIRLAVSLVLKSSEADSRMWQDVPCQGDTPDIEEITDYLILKLGRNQ